MRRTTKGTVTVRAISGTHVVFLAFDIKPSDLAGLMGFAIQRDDRTEGDTIWLRGNKTFASVRGSTGIEDASSHEHPFQVFQWADYAAKPGREYTYRVVPMYGSPGQLTQGSATRITIETEPLRHTEHEVYFNRGAIASQAFARRFPGMTLEEVGEPGYAWLTRDLLPGLLDFISRASDASYSLHAALYELRDEQVLLAFRDAHRRRATVQIVYHAKDDDTGVDNDAHITHARIRSLCLPRTNAKLMHNKFIVLARNGSPMSVWTGSTNLSRNALYGQLNVGHVVHDPAVAEAFMEYWKVLRDDPPSSDMKDWSVQATPVPEPTDASTCVPFFSPQRGRSMLQYWIDLAFDAHPALFMTFPFGITRDFRGVFDRNDGVLRFALLDKYVNGGNQVSRQAAIDEIERFRRFPNIGLSIGERIFVEWIDGWRKEHSGIGVNVDWVHTKFMLIDPLGEHPVTFTGSANFSAASVNDNDENMLLIRGNTRVADIYFGEFMRIFAHHRFRESVKRHLDEFGEDAFLTWRPQDLIEDWQVWTAPHFEPGSEKDIKRRYFVGS